MAQYRELAAFAQFGSDLDKATKSQLDRGQRLVELLKQPQYQPFPVEEQVVALYAGVNGFLDDVAVEDILRFERGLLGFMRMEKSAILTDIREKKAIDSELEELLKAAINSFKETFYVNS